MVSIGLHDRDARVKAFTWAGTSVIDIPVYVLEMSIGDVTISFYRDSVEDIDEIEEAIHVAIKDLHYTTSGGK